MSQSVCHVYPPTTHPPPCLPYPPQGTYSVSFPLLLSFFSQSSLYPLCALGHNREIQPVSVDSDDIIAFDWTFAAAKSYSDKSIKCIFDGIKGSTKEILFIFAVGSTKTSEIAHGLTLAKMARKNFKPRLLYTDTAPASDSFYKTIFGESLELKLGLFHLIHRIVDKLDQYSGLYWECLVKLKDCMYFYNPDDWNALVKTMREGTFYSSGKRLSAVDIKDLMHSKKWNQQFSGFLRKQIRKGSDIAHRIELWISEWENRKDDVGRRVFTHTTKSVALEQTKKAKHASDPDDLMLYKKIPTSSNTTHQLPRWESIRPESSLELFHLFLGHYANVGCSKELADLLLIGGTAAHNTKRRWISQINQQKLQGRSFSIPVEYIDTPIYWNHSYLI